MDGGKPKNPQFASLAQQLGYKINPGLPCLRRQGLRADWRTYLAVRHSIWQWVSETPALLWVLLHTRFFICRDNANSFTKLNFAAYAVYGGWTFLRQIIDALNTLTWPYHRKQMIQTMWIDLVVDRFHGDLQWQNLLCLHWAHVNCQIFHWCRLVGGVGHYQQDWFYVNWQCDFLLLQSCHINELELFTVLLALRRWGPQLSYKWIVIYPDNTVNLGLTKELVYQRTMVWLREIFWISAVHNFRVTSRYSQTTDNTTADVSSFPPIQFSTFLQ